MTKFQYTHRNLLAVRTENIRAFELYLNVLDFRWLPPYCCYEKGAGMSIFCSVFRVCTILLFSVGDVSIFFKMKYNMRS